MNTPYVAQTFSGKIPINLTALVKNSDEGLPMITGVTPVAYWKKQVVIKMEAKNFNMYAMTIDFWLII